MRVRRCRYVPEFAPQSGSRFRSLWEYELDRGEETPSNEHSDAEVVFYLTQGAGAMTIDRTNREVKSGQVVFIPPATPHVLANTSADVLRAFSIESTIGEEGRDNAEAIAQSRETIGHLQKIIDQLPTQMDAPAAIQSIVKLFDIGGRLSEQIEEAMGLDNAEALAALTSIENKIMASVVEITARYLQRTQPKRRHHRRF